MAAPRRSRRSKVLLADSPNPMGLPVGQTDTICTRTEITPTYRHFWHRRQIDSTSYRFSTCRSPSSGSVETSTTLCEWQVGKHGTEKSTRAICAISLPVASACWLTELVDATSRISAPQQPESGRSTFTALIESRVQTTYVIRERPWWLKRKKALLRPWTSASGPAVPSTRQVLPA